MNRLRQFVRNAGYLGVAQTVIVSLAILVMIVRAFAVGLGVYSLVGSLLAICLGYALQNRMANNIRVTRYTMNGCGACFIVTVALAPHLYQPPLVQGLTPIFVSVYISCFFFLMSHPDISVQA